MFISGLRYVVVFLCKPIETFLYVTSIESLFFRLTYTTEIVTKPNEKPVYILDVSIGSHKCQKKVQCYVQSVHVTLVVTEDMKGITGLLLWSVSDFFLITVGTWRVGGRGRKGGRWD